MTSTPGYQYLLLLIGVTLCNQISAQIIGQDICACSPSVYRFNLDFTVDSNEACNSPNIATGDGISESRCLITPLRNPTVTDLVPVGVSTIEIFEYGQDLSLLADERIDGNFVHGDFFDYESVTFNPEGITSSQDIPRSIQITLTGQNAEGNRIVNISIITMTNRCSAYPVFDVGGSMGFIVFVSSVTSMFAAFLSIIHDFKTLQSLIQNCRRVVWILRIQVFARLLATTPVIVSPLVSHTVQQTTSLSLVLGSWNSRSI